MTGRKHLRDDEGAALVMALVFILVVSLFALVALRKSETTLVSGGQVRNRGELQYALDGGVERAVQLLRAEMASGTPTTCANVAAPTVFTVESGGLDLNGHRIDYSCQTLAGRASLTGNMTNTNHALVVTSPNAGALATQSGVSHDLELNGSIYLNGKVANSDLKKRISMTGTDASLVSPLSRAGCAADLAALTEITLDGTGQLKACTEQSVTDATPVVTMLPAPTVAPSGSGWTIGGCRVFLPGLYTSSPSLAGANYFVSGRYYFHNIGTWTIDGSSQVIAGQRTVSTDSAIPSNNCSAMTDGTALANATVAAAAALLPANYLFSTGGATWVFGGTSGINMKKGTLTMFTPTPAVVGEHAVNIVGVQSTGNGYTMIPLNHTILTGGGNNVELRLNAKLLAPTAHVDLFSTNNTVAAAGGGVVVYTIDLQASASGTGGLVISAPGGITVPPPPFRTVRIVTTDRNGTSAATNTAVLTISNFGTYAVDVLGWRTG